MINAGKIKHSLRYFKEVFGIKESWNIKAINIENDALGAQHIYVYASAPEFPVIVNTDPVPEVTVTKVSTAGEQWVVAKK